MTDENSVQAALYRTFVKHFDLERRLDQMQERQRLGNVLAICQCLLLIVVAAILIFKH
jgi:hypothetical protein